MKMKETRVNLCLPKDAIYDEMDSPFGILTIIASSAGLHAILWDNDFNHLKSKGKIDSIKQSTTDKTIIKTKLQLHEYFQGKRKIFDLPLILQGTSFQLAVWNTLLKIPYAKTISYGKQAEKVGNKNKARACGMVNGSNPIPIVIPCHRVIGSNGKLVGFGGGLDKKAYLLNLEQTYGNHLTL